MIDVADKCGESSVVDGGFANLKDAGDYLSMSRATLYNLMEAGELSYARFGRARRIPWRALREYATRNLVSR